MRKIIFTYLNILIFAFFNIAQSALAQGKLQSNMVVQREQPVIIRGTAAPGQKVVVKVQGFKGSNAQGFKAKADAEGQYTVTLSPLPAGGPYDITVGDTTYTNILSGDVWLCSGQSNMAFKMRETQTSNLSSLTSNCAAQQRLRLLNLDAKYPTDNSVWTDAQIDEVERYDYLKHASWTEAIPEAVADFSAVAYFFGEMLADSLQIPIGLICNAVGGTGTEAWISHDVLEKEFPEILTDWQHNELIQDWVRGRGLHNNPRSDMHPYKPGYMYEAGIRPLLDTPVKGVIWYQGESNAQDIPTHAKLFKLLVQNWRNTLNCQHSSLELPLNSLWTPLNLPFYFVQLSSIGRPTWPEFRDSQRRLADEIENCYMAVSSDQGHPTDVHPKNKRPVGERLALQALHHTYGHDIVSEGPRYGGMTVKDNKVCITFTGCTKLHTSDHKAVRGFEVKGRDGRYYKAKVLLVGNKVCVYSDMVKNPVGARYAWKPYTDANLVGDTDLPVSTFTTEDYVSPLEECGQGVSAMFCGRIGGDIILAGGANFPYTPAAQGGKKKYYDQVYLLPATSSLLPVTSLPAPAAYGASVQMDGSIIFLGGENESGLLSDVYELKQGPFGYEFETLPSMPVAMSNICAAKVGEKIYVVGNKTKDERRKTKDALLLIYDISTRNWTESTYPSLPRTQAVCASVGDKLYIWGGFYQGSKSSRSSKSSSGSRGSNTVFTDGLCLDTKTGEWAILPAPVDENGDMLTLTGGCATAVGDTIYAAGGVNKDIFLRAISGEYGDDYMLHEPEWYKFSPYLLAYYAEEGIESKEGKEAQWHILKKDPRFARAGAGIVFPYIIQGESKPGIRSSDITDVSSFR